MISNNQVKILVAGVLIFVAYKMYSKSNNSAPKSATSPSLEECKEKHIAWKKFSMTARFVSAEAMEEEKKKMLGECYDSYGQRR